MNRGVAQLCEIKTWSLWVVSCSSLSGTNGDLRTPSMIEINMFPKMLQTDHHRPRFWWILKHLQPQVWYCDAEPAACACYYIQYIPPNGKPNRDKGFGKSLQQHAKSPKMASFWELEGVKTIREITKDLGPMAKHRSTKLRKQKQLLTACIKRQPCRVPKKWQTNHGYLSLNFKQV